MNRIVGWLLTSVGAFLLVAALVAQFWAPGMVEKTPLEVNSTTYLDGTADKLNTSTGEVENLPVKVTSVTKTDSEASDDDVVVFVSTQCVVVDEGDPADCVEANDPQNRLINASTDVFATDRVTAEPVEAEGYLPEGSEQKSGLINKFPFNTEKKSYEVWDSILKEAVPAEFDRVERLDGLETYVFAVEVPETPATVVGDVEGIYSLEKELWIEPRTGSIIRQAQVDTRTTEDGDTLIALDIAFTDEQVSDNVASARDSIDQLDLITKTVPLVGFIGGALLLLVGLFISLRSRRQH